MAPSFYLCQNSCQNLSINAAENELARAPLKAVTESNSSLTLASSTLIEKSATDIVLVPIAAFVPAALLSTMKLFKQFIQTCIKRVKNQDPLLLSVKTKEKVVDKPLNAKNPEQYFKNLHMEYFSSVHNAKTISKL